MHKSHLILCLFSVLLLIISCNREEGHLNVSEMEDLLYDMHMAKYMAQQCHPDSVGYYDQLYHEAILQKYGLTEKDLETTMLYYNTNSDKLFKIYTALADRMESMNISGGMTTSFTENGDTVNIWDQSTNVLLLANGRNMASFSIEADTVVKPGDRLELRMFSTAIYPEGDRTCLASVRMEYADSTAYTTLNIGGFGAQFMQLPLSDQRPLHSIHITLLQNATWSDKPKILSLSNISLLRYRTHSPQTPETETTDNENSNPESQDSLSQPTDTVRKTLITTTGRAKPAR